MRGRLTVCRIKLDEDPFEVEWDDRCDPCTGEDHGACTGCDCECQDGAL
jgi:hypothetical protein